MNIYQTVPNRKIEALVIGKPLSDYPFWFHEAIMNKTIVVTTEFSKEQNCNLVSKIKVKNIYGGVDIGLKDKDYICKGVAKEIFVCRKAIFEFLYTKIIK